MAVPRNLPQAAGHQHCPKPKESTLSTGGHYRMSPRPHESTRLSRFDGRAPSAERLALHRREGRRGALTAEDRIEALVAEPVQTVACMAWAWRGVAWMGVACEQLSAHAHDASATVPGVR